MTTALVDRYRGPGVDLGRGLGGDEVLLALAQHLERRTIEQRRVTLVAEDEASAGVLGVDDDRRVLGDRTSRCADRGVADVAVLGPQRRRQRAAWPSR